MAENLMNSIGVHAYIEVVEPADNDNGVTRTKYSKYLYCAEELHDIDIVKAKVILKLASITESDFFGFDTLRR